MKNDQSMMLLFKWSSNNHTNSLNANCSSRIEKTIVTTPKEEEEGQNKAEDKGSIADLFSNRLADLKAQESIRATVKNLARQALKPLKVNFSIITIFMLKSISDHESWNSRSICFTENDLQKNIFNIFEYLFREK